MTTQEIANRLVELCRTGQNDTAYTELFADNAQAIEPAGSPTGNTQGLEALRAKGREFQASIEQVHRSETSDPLVAENFFSISMLMEVTFKGAPAPITFDEIVVYEVKDGKIVKEQFFYTVNPPSMG